MSHRPIELSSYARQRGATTLLITVIILFLASLLVIAVSRTTVMEQRLSANEMRSRQAFEAAQAGFDHALDYLTSDPLGLDRKINVDGSAGSDSLAERMDGSVAAIAPRCLRADDDCSDPVAQPFAEYRFAYCNPESTDPECPPDNVGEPINCDFLDTTSEIEWLRRPLIVSCGWSDDDLGRRLIRQGFRTIPTLGNPSTVPFITKGSVGVTGSATLSNFYTNLNLWLGGPLTNIGNAGKTYVRDPNIPAPSKATEPPAPPPSPPNPACDPNPCYIKVTDKTTIGPDVIDNDPTLANLSNADMFTLFTGAADPEDYKLNVATMDFTEAEAEANPSPLAGLLGQAVFIDAQSDAFTLPNTTIGSRTRPVVLVVDGDMTGGGSPVVHGVVYVTGDLNVQGNITVYGGMVVQGDVTGTGSLDIVYDPFAVENADDNIGRSAPIPGDWRDWP